MHEGTEHMATKAAEKAPEAITPTTSIDGPMTMDEALDLEPEGWNPEPGEKIVGRVLFVTTTDGGHPEYNKPGQEGYPLVAIWTGSKVVGVHAFHTALRSGVERSNPQPGDEIGIKYLGLQLTNKDGEPVGQVPGKGYENYNVIVRKATATPALTA